MTKETRVCNVLSVKEKHVVGRDIFCREMSEKLHKMARACREMLISRDHYLGDLKLRRGLLPETIEANMLGLNPRWVTQDASLWGLTDREKLHIPPGYTIPIFDSRERGKVISVKIRTFKGEPKYWHVPIQGLKTLPTFTIGPLTAGNALICESELDACLYHQELPEMLVVALSGCSKGIDPFITSALMKCPRVLICTDNDEAGVKASRKIRHQFADNSIFFLSPDSKNWADGHIAGQCSIRKVFRHFINENEEVEEEEKAEPVPLPPKVSTPSLHEEYLKSIDDMLEYLEEEKGRRDRTGPLLQYKGK